MQEWHFVQLCPFSMPHLQTLSLCSLLQLYVLIFPLKMAHMNLWNASKKHMDCGRAQDETFFFISFVRSTVIGKDLQLNLRVLQAVPLPPHRQEGLHKRCS